MTTLSPLFDLHSQPLIDARTELIREVLVGLRSRPRTLKPWMLYDDLGSRLFEQITDLPEYYPTRTERLLLSRHADAIVASVADRSRPLRLVELGAGSASKTCLLLAAAARMHIDVVYMPLDVSADALDVACENIQNAFPKVLLDPRVVNYVESPRSSKNSTVLRSHSILAPVLGTSPQQSPEPFSATCASN
ncbi:MAG TPA: L-histidine N(alpha)-methyltransferase [Terracidiphilus sp.]|jgi:uncharacterized SAM-dependent methyltransferase